MFSRGDCTEQEQVAMGATRGKHTAPDSCANLALCVILDICSVPDEFVAVETASTCRVRSVVLQALQQLSQCVTLPLLTHYHTLNASC